MSTIKLSQPEKLFLKNNEELIRQNKFQEFFDQVKNYSCKNKFFHFFYYYGINPLKYMKSIPKEMFYQDKEICDLVIPDNIEIICEYAFTQSSIKNVTLPKKLNIIQESAFKRCEQLESVEIPQHTQEIGLSAFTYCSKLKEVTFHGAPKLYGCAVFWQCDSLEKFYIDNKINADDKQRLCEQLGGQFLSNDPEIILESLQNNSQRLVEKIVKIGNKWQVQSEKGRNMGTYDTKKEAEKRLKQVEYFKHKNESIQESAQQKNESMGNKDRKIFYKCGIGGVYYVSIFPQCIREKNPKRVYVLEQIRNTFQDARDGMSLYNKNTIGNIDALREYLGRFPNFVEINTLEVTAYHGSQTDNLKFRNDYPLYLTDDKELAIDFARGYNFNYALLSSDIPTLYTFKVKMKNPLYIHTEDDYDNYMDIVNYNTIVAELADQGYDGIVYKEDGSPTYYMVFNPEEQVELVKKEKL